MSALKKKKHEFLTFRSIITGTWEEKRKPYHGQKEPDVQEDFKGLVKPWVLGD